MMTITRRSLLCENYQACQLRWVAGKAKTQREALISYSCYRYLALLPATPPHVACSVAPARLIGRSSELILANLKCVHDSVLKRYTFSQDQ